MSHNVTDARIQQACPELAKQANDLIALKEQANELLAKSKLAFPELANQAND
jgi:hypothetical protein